MIDKHVSEPRDWRNKAFEYRKNSATQKLQELEANHWTNNSPLKSHRAHSQLISDSKLKTFDKRTKSLLPPINQAEDGNFDSVSSAKLGLFTPKNKLKLGTTQHSRNSGSVGQMSIHSQQAIKSDNVSISTSMIRRLEPHTQQQILEKIHQMRLRAHDLRSLENVVKPNLPLIGTEEKEKILKQYFDTKQKLQ